MAKLNYKNGVTSVILRVKIMDSTSTSGAAKTGLTEASAGLIIATIADNESATTRYRASSSEVETISTLGTFAAPTSGKCRFKEVDSTNHPGLYEIQIADARWAVSNARSVIVSVLGASGAAQVDAEVQLEPVPANVTQLLGTAWLTPGTAGTPDVNVKLAGGTAWASGSLTSGVFAAGAINAAAIADGAIDRATFAADTGLQSIRSNTAQDGTISTITLDAGASSVDDFYKNTLIHLTGGSGANQVQWITGYVGSTKVATVRDGWGTNPDATTTFTIMPTAMLGFIQDYYNLLNGISGKMPLANYLLGTSDLNGKLNAGAISSDAITSAKIADGAITAAKIGSDAITNAKVADDLAIGSVTGAVGSVTGNVGGNVTGSVGSLATQAKADVNAEVDTALADINLDHLVKAAVDTDFATTVHVDSVVGQLAQTADGGYARSTDSLEAVRDRGDAAWTTATGFSTHSAADVWAVATRVLTAGTNIVLAKGTGVTGFNDLSAAQVNAEADTALADYDGPTYAELTTEIDAVQTDIAVITGRLTSARASYLDNLNVGGNVASSTEVTAIQNNTRVVRVVPTQIERPDSGTVTYRIELLLYDSTGNMEVPDSAPTIALVNQAGTDRSSRLDSTTMALVSTGRYRAIYTADVADALEQLVWTFSVVEGGATRLYGNTSLVVDMTAVDFTSSDRTMLTNVYNNVDVAVSSRLAPTVSGRTLDVTANGNAGIDWANIDNPTATVSFTGTTVGTVTVTTTATNLTNAATNGDLTADMKASVNTEVDTALADVGLTTTVTGRVDAAISSRASQSSVNTLAGYVDTEVAAIKAKTDQLAFTTANRVDATAVTVSDKTGYSLSATGLDAVPITAPTGVASSLREMLVQSWRRFFKRVTKDDEDIKTYADDGTTVLTTQAYTSSGDDDDVGAAT